MGRVNILWALLALTAVFALATEVEVLRPQHRLGQDLLAAVQAAVGPEGTVTLDQRTGALVVSGPPEAIARAKKILAELDIAPRLVRLEISAIGTNDLSNVGIDIDWTVGAGSWRIGRIRGGEILDDGSVRIGAQVRHRVFTSSSASRQVIRVLEGETAVLIAGTRSSYDAQHYSWSQAFGAHLSGNINHVQASLLARPRLTGDDVVMVEIMPQFATFGPEGMHTQQLTTMSTVVRMRDGETVLLGSSTTQGRQFTSDLLHSVNAGAGESNMVMTLRVRVE